MEFQNNVLRKVAYSIICVAMGVSLYSCKELNNNPPPQTDMEFTVNVKEIQEQLGYQDNTVVENGGSSPSFAVSGADSPTSTQVKKLLIGAILVNNRTTPYTNEYSITQPISTIFG